MCVAIGPARANVAWGDWECSEGHCGGVDFPASPWRARSRIVRVKFLIDTNIFIPLEPTSPADVEARTAVATELARIATECGHQLYLHPASKADIGRNADQERSRLRLMLSDKYPCLDSSPPISAQLRAVLGPAQRGSRDWVDHQLIAAVAGDAVDFLVTEDQPIHRKARRLGLDGRVCTVDDALSIIRALFEVPPVPPPAAQSVKAYQLDSGDPIFDTLREDYENFDLWLTKCKREHRQAWYIHGCECCLAAVCIVKTETPGEPGLQGKTLKICTFKVSDQYKGFRYGELLLKPVFEYARLNSYESMYVTVFEKHGQLISLFEDFGFRQMQARTPLGELILAKPLSFTHAERDQLDPLPFNVRYGPFAVKIEGVPSFVVPVRPEYHRLLFPEFEQQPELWPGAHPFGNSLRKAYLSNASIRTIGSGANLLFYRSGDVRGLTALGVVEGTMVSSSPQQIAQYVGKRTVYRFEQIQSMCEREVLAILFRQSRLLDQPIPFRELKGIGLISVPPQSIVGVPKEATQWLRTRIDA